MALQETNLVLPASLQCNLSLLVLPLLRRGRNKILPFTAGLSITSAAISIHNSSGMHHGSTHAYVLQDIFLEIISWVRQYPIRHRRNQASE